MGHDLYTAFWKEILNKLKAEFQSGKSIVQFALPELGKVGGRNQDNYSGYVRYRFGVLQSKTNSAPYRDLEAAIKTNVPIKPYLNNELEIKVSKDFQLTASYKQISQADLVAAYKKLVNNGNEGEMYKWVELAKPHFDLNAVDLASMFKSVNFHNLIFHNAKAVLYHILNVYPEEVRAAFKALFDEDTGLHTRILDFRSTMEKLYRKVEPHLPSHQDERSIATYLTYNSPDKYSLYKEGFYLKYCKLLSIAPQEVNKKYIHYLEILKDFIDKYVKPDKELLELVEKFKPANGYSDPNHTLLAQDILYKTLESSWDEEQLEPSKKNTPNKLHIMPHLNTILYGPPGTGKTYNTLEKAIRIANPDFFSEERTRQDIRTEFDRLKTEGQIEFITFHQSMSYEDFIEGIKPKKPEKNDTYLKYEIQEGIFKRMVTRANYKPTPQATVFSLSDEEFSHASFYKISLGNTAIEDDEQIYRYCIDNSCIALGWGGANDFGGMTEHDIQEMVPDRLERFAAQAVNYFIHYLKQNDFVVVSYGNLRFRALGRVNGDYEYRDVDGLEVKQFRKVEWLLKDVDIPVEELYNKQFSQQTIYKLNRSEIKREFFVKGQVTPHDAITPKNYVLIIDEINRGNIAQIFGELITLIEPDKRKGAPEALEVMLPYSKELFSVPCNLFILGTMNTADRSVEALDTALRRRFVFEPMMPKPELLSTQSLLTRILNTDTSFDFDWEDNGWRELADPFFDLVGAPANLENELKHIEQNDDSEWWTEQSLASVDFSEFEGVNLEMLLFSINQRLEVLLSKDHLVGHAWLMGVYSLEELQAAFKHKILPLLQEYFYNNQAKIGLVLGDAFFEQQSLVSKNIFASFKSGADLAEDYTDKMMFALKDASELTREDFKSIYEKQ